MRTRWAAALAVASLATLTACATAAPPGSPGSPDGEWPADRTFLSTSVTENGTAKPLVEGTRIELSFGDDGRVSANAGCNHLGGTGRLESEALVIDSLSMTEMGCPGLLHEQDTWLADFLISSPTMRRSGDELTLAGPTVTIVLADREVADPDRPLTGTRWVVDTIMQGDTASSVPSDAPAVLTIDASGGFVASTGCVGGELRGSATVSGDRVTFTVTEAQPCAGASNALDDAVRATLAGEVGYEITARRLRLVGSAGSGLGLQAEG